jgi:hypothetical protein
VTRGGSTFPHSPESLKDFAGGATDGFIWAVSNIGGGYASSVAYIGTDGDDRINAVMDGFLAGSTNGTYAFPTTSNSWVRRGGRDAFVLRVATSYTIIALQAAFYIGGNGDDEPYALARAEGKILVAGETFSSDFPLVGRPIQSQRKGSSDAFIASFDEIETTLLTSTLLGGSGTDRIQAMLIPSPSKCIVAGTTSSPDFPVKDAAQSTYGGGPSDAFFAHLPLDLSQTIRASFLGGSGADEALAATPATFVKGAFIAGATSSPNFPLRNAVQSTFAGGTTDAFIAQTDANGAILSSTYFGGSGNDRILTLSSTNSGAAAVAGGSTTSANLPGGPAETRGLGPADGFIATFTDSALTLPASATVAGGFRRNIPLDIGDTRKAIAAGTATLVSSNPALVLASLDRHGTTQSTSTASWSQASGIPRSLTAECLASSGSATLTLRVPTYTDRSMVIRCSLGRPSFYLEKTMLLRSKSEHSMSVAVTELDTAETVTMDAVSLKTPPISFTLSDPSSLVFTSIYSETSYGNSIPAFYYFRIEARRVGLVQITLSGVGYETQTQVVEVLPTFSNTELPISPGFMRSDFVIRDPSQNRTITIRSLDPSKVLLANNANGTGVASIVFNTDSTGSYWIRGLASVPMGSTAQLEYSEANAPTVIRTVRFYPPTVAREGSPRESYTVPVGAQKELVIPVQTDSIPRAFISLSPGETPLPMTVQNSNTAAVGTPGSIPFGSQSFITVTGRAVGSSQISFSAPPPLGTGGARTIHVQVTAPTLTAPDFDLGKDLQADIEVQLPYPTTRDVTGEISTSTPSLLQLEPRSDLPPVSSMQLVIPALSWRVFLRVHGFASQGTGLISINIPGYPPLTVNARMRPAAWIWTESKVTQEQDSLIVAPRLALAAIDPVSLLPLATQWFRPGIKILPTIVASNPAVARISEDGNLLTTFGPGLSAFTLLQPPGFATPAIRKELAVNVIERSSAPEVIFRVNWTPGGSVVANIPCSQSSCEGKVTQDQRIDLQAVPSPGYVFVRWTISSTCGTSASCSTSYRVNSSAFAVFELDRPLQFLPLAPCRIVDTRNPTGPFGGPALAGPRNFPIRTPGTPCGIPANAAAYSLNVTVVPRGALGYITIWPGWEPRPVVSTLNSLDGRIKANAAIVPGNITDGSINVFSTDLTDLILDINGVFVPPGTANAQAFYSVPPCRIADTRIAGGTIAALATRTFAITGCGIPATATAYALNVTAVPKSVLGYLTLWPNNGSPRPTVSTLNALTGTVTANLAIVPAGNTGAVNAFVTDASETVVDVTGYFAPPGQPNALAFRTLAPCRVLDTRSPDNILNAISTRDSQVECGVPPTAKAYSLNATVLPTSILGYLTLFPAGSARPVVSTLNAVDGSLTSNAAIVPAGLNGAISAFVTERTHLILDINGYFAP